MHDAPSPSLLRSAVVSHMLLTPIQLRLVFSVEFVASFRLNNSNYGLNNSNYGVMTYWAVYCHIADMLANRSAVQASVAVFNQCCKTLQVLQTLAAQTLFR
jgi:hypothetical protein